MKTTSFFFVLVCASSFFYSCSNTQDIVVTPNFIANNNLPSKPLFSINQNNDYFQEGELLNSPNTIPAAVSNDSLTKVIATFNSFLNSSIGLNEAFNWYQPYSMRVRPSGFYGDHYYSSYANGFYWGVNQVGYTTCFFPLPSATFLNYQRISSLGFKDRIRYQAMNQNRFRRPGTCQSENTQITYHYKKSSSYNYRTNKKTNSQQGYYHYTNNTPQIAYYNPRTSGGSGNTGGGNQSGNNRTRSTNSPATTRSYPRKTSGGGSGGSGNSGAQNRQQAPPPTSVNRKF